MVQSFPPVTSGRVSTLPKTEEYPNIAEQPSEETEYKAQFAWPHKTECEPSGLPRKSVSMNVIRSSEGMYEKDLNHYLQVFFSCIL